MMQSGRLRHQIAIQRPVQMGRSSLNAPIIVWQDWSTPFAEINVVRGKEYFDSSTKQRYSQQVYQFTVRYEEVIGMTASMRIVHDGQFFDIKAPLPDAEYRREVVIEATLQDTRLESAALLLQIEEIILAGAVGSAFSLQLAASGGQTPYTFSDVEATLPPGLSIDQDSGLISGMPTTAGDFTSSGLQVEDAAGVVASLPPLSLTISG